MCVQCVQFTNGNLQAFLKASLELFSVTVPLKNNNSQPVSKQTAHNKLC